MEISVPSILQSNHSVTRYGFEERIELPGEGERLLEPIKGDFTITRASTQILQMTGKFRTRLQLVCDRCGNVFEQPADFELDEPLEVVEDAPDSEEVEEQVSSTGYLNATDLIRQGLLLSLPTRRLCGCEPATTLSGEDRVDPRWSALRSFGDQSKNGNG